MGIILNPVFFLSALVGLFVLAVFAAFASFRDTGKQKKDVQKLLDAEIRSRQEMAASLSLIKTENERLKNELAVKTQMYDGLKSQYEELEKDFNRLSEEQANPQITLVSPVKDKPVEPPPIDITEPAPKEEEKPVPSEAPQQAKSPEPQTEEVRSTQSIAELIQNLQEIQKSSINKNPPLTRGIS